MKYVKLKTKTKLSDERIIVNTKKELIEIIKSVMHNENQKLLVDKLIVRLNCYDSDKKELALTEQQYSTMANSTLTRSLDCLAVDSTLVTSGKKKTTIEVGPSKTLNYTNDIITVDFNKGFENKLYELDKDENQSIAVERIKSHGLYFNPETKVAYIPDRIEWNDKATGVLRNELVWKKNGSSEKGQSKFDSQFDKTGYIHYVLFNWSNSEQRKLGATLINADKYNEVARYFLLNETLLGGGLEYHLQKAGNNIDKIKKVGTRLGLKNPADINLGKIGTKDWGVILCSKFESNNDLNDKIASYLAKCGIKLDEEVIDGAGMVNAQAIVEMLLDNNIEVTESIVAGLVLQCRNVGLGNKSADMVYRERVFKLMLNYLKVNYTLAHTPEEFYALEKDGKKAYYIIGNTNDIAAIYDMNAAKIPNFESSDFVFSILDVATAPKKAYLSKQQNSKSMYLNKEATIEATKNACAQAIADAIDNKYDSDFKVGQVSADFYFGLNKERAIKDIVAISALGKDLTKYIMGMVSNNRVPVTGGSYRAQIDMTSFFINDPNAYTLGVTPEGYVECYNPDILKKHRKEIKPIEKAFKANLTEGMDLDEALEIMRLALNEVIVGEAIKYPAAGHYEFELFRPLTKLELKYRLKANIDDKDLRESLYLYFTDCCEGCVIMAPINILKHKLAGMDFDYDGITIITEKSFVNILKEAYKNNSITGIANVPSKTTIICKNTDEQFIKDALTMKYANYNFEELYNEFAKSWE